MTIFGLASGAYCFRDLSLAQANSLSQRYNQFISSSACSENLAQEITLRELAYPVSMNPEAFTVEGQYTPMLERTPDQLTVTGINFQATLRWGKPMLATLAVTPGPDSALINAIENFLRVVSAYRVLSKRGLLLHSAGLVVDEQAYLFVGRSGAGKTTLTRKAHSAGAGILSDDINTALPSEDECFRAYPVPFAGDFGQTPDLLSPGGYPLAALCFLEQGGAATLEPLTNAAAVARLVAACPFVNDDPDKAPDLLEAAANLVRQVPMRKLISRREDDFDLIHALLREITDDR